MCITWDGDLSGAGVGVMVLTEDYGLATMSIVIGGEGKSEVVFW